MPPTVNNNSTDTGADGREWSAPYVLRLLSAFLAAGLGLVALLGWIAGLPWLDTFTAGTVPMAPSTALLFLLYGTAIFFHARVPRNPGLHVPCLALGLSATAVALLLLALTLLGIHSDVEHLGMRIAGTEGGAPIGHMSPVTAFCFTLVGVSFLVLALFPPGPRWRPAAALGLASLVALTGTALLLAYLFGSPAFYDTGIIPPAMPTSAAFLMLGISLLVPSVQQTWRRDDLPDAAGVQAAYICLTTFVLLAAGIVLGGYFYLRHFERQQRVNVERQLLAIANMQTAEITDWREDYLNDAAILFKNEELRALLQRYFQKPEDADVRRQLQRRIGPYVDGFHFDQVRLIDAQGETRMSVPAERTPVSAAILDRIPEVLRSRRVTLMDFYLCEDCRKVHMGLLVPILNETDGRSPWGVLAMQIDPEARLYPYIRQWPTLSTTAETLLVRREGDKAVFLNELRFQKNTALKLRVSIDENRDLPAVKAAMGQEGIVEGVDYRGVAVIAAVRAVPDSPWFLVARMDTSEAYLPARDRLWATVAAVLFLTMGAGVGIGLAQRQQRMNYYRQKLAAAEDLAGERRNLKAIFDASPVGLLLMDDSALVTAVNDVASRLAGKTSAEMINRQPGEALGCIHASDDARGCGKGSCCPSCPIRAALEGVLRSGHAVRAVEVQPVLVIGGAKVSPWLEINAEPLTIDGRRHMIASVVNITGRKQAEQQLHEANSHLTQLNQELASAAARVKGLMDDVIKENVFTGRFANPNLTPCWEAKKCGNSACPSYQNRENLRCWEVAGTFCGGEVQGQFAKKFGTCTLCEVYKSARANPVLDLGETFNSMVAILKDRHEELEKAAFQLEQAIERANLMAAEAVQANAAKSEFLANMSHEIRTPMTAILGYTDLLSDPSISPSDRDNHVAVIRRNGEHLLELINDILDISKIESGKFVMDVQECSLPSLIADVISMMRVRTEQHSISLSVEYETEIPETVCTDGARVRQALVNLIGNAVKFTERGGVRVAASFLPAWRDGRPAVRVKVIDTGIGIGEEKLAQLFQPFVQADASTSRRYGGTGLGLAISRHFAELLGGELVAESTAGTGSTFTLTIPTGSMDGVRMLENPAEAVHSEAAGLSLPAIGEKFLAGIRVLLAEDGPDNQRLIRLILSTAGAEVELASDGHEAVSNASSGSYDVVLMDIQMPVMDGYEATRTLRLQGYAGPILALTAHAMTGDRDKCLASGCTDHLTKPIDRGRLIEAVARYAGKKIPGAGQAAPTPESPAGDPEIMRSQYANDPELAEVLAKFVAGLPAQVEDMSRVAQAGRREELQRLAHRLKGAGGSYGYPSLTEAARELEDAARAGDVEAAGMAIGRLTAMSRAIERGRVPESVSKEVKS